MKKQYGFCRMALLLCAWLISTAAWAYDFEADGIYYNITSSDDKTVAVTFEYSSGVSYSGKVIIPETVTNEDIEYRVTAIGGRAFYGCTRLSSVTIPNSVTTIGGRAFDGCRGLTSVTIPNSVTTIGDYAFDNCTGLKVVHISDLDAWWHIKFSGYYYSNPLYYAHNLYLNGSPVIELSVPADITAIDNRFYNCTSITSITIPNSVTSIGINAFSGCTGLKVVHISDLDAWWHIKFSGYSSNPLYYAHNLYLNDSLVTELTIPEDITTIDDRFQNCTSITSVTIPNSVTSIVNSAFAGCTGLTSVTIPESITSISSNTFSGCTGLTSITIPNSVTSISSDAFSGCTGLEKFEGKWASSDQRCLIMEKTLHSFAPSGLSSYTIPESVTHIGSDAFSGCTGLTSVTIPESVTYIGNDAFSGCTGLKKLRIEDGTEVLELRLDYASGYKSPFDDCPLDTIYLGRNNISYGMFSLEHPDHEYILFENNKKSIVSLTIGNRITAIGEEAFSGWTGLTSVTIGDSVNTIGKKAFSGCTSLKSVRSKADSVGVSAFYGCTALDTLELPYVKDIGYSNSSNRDDIGIFSCTGLKKLDIGSAEHLPAGFLSNLTQLEDLTIPYIGAGSKNEATGKNGLLGALFGTKSVSGMKAVEQYYNETKAITSYLPTGLRKLTITDGCEELPYGALYNVSTLREVILPASLYMVGEKAFYGCAGIEHLYCRGAAPAGCYENAFTGMRLATCVLHVPHNSVELYQRSDGWKNFYFIQGEEPIRIDVVKNIAHAGIVTGLTEYALYDEALLTAIAHSGYRFVSWMEDGSEICTQESYRFRAESNRNLTAVFMPVFNENDVEITPSAHTASLTWETEEGVDEYSLTLYSDAAMTDTVQTIRLDIAAQKVRATAMSSIEVENLDAETEYYYVLTGISADGTIASQKTGSFKTTESTSDALKETPQADGHITVYNLQGVPVLETDDAADLKTLQNGAYIVNGKKMIIVR